jgi:N6-adenosine-specific RNA methylase IME4
VVTAKDETEAARAQQALAVIPAAVALPATITSREAARTAARERVPEPAITPEPADTSDGLYRSVVIDPPWPIEKIERDERPDQGQALDYPTMPLWCTDMALGTITGQKATSCWQRWISWTDFDETDDEPTICQSIECVVGHQLAAAADNDGCHIYLWTTHRFLPDSFDLFDRWGVTYQCLMTWRKNVGITPFSWMYDTEHVLFGRLGSLKLDQLGLRLSFEAPVTGHSVKPDVFFDRVRAASPTPRLEMFTRRPHDGFTAWGNEVSNGVC